LGQYHKKEINTGTLCHRFGVDLNPDPITLSETDLNLLRNISTPNAQLALKQEL